MPLLADLAPGVTQTWIIVAYLAALIVLGLASNTVFRGTAVDYFVASRGVGPVLLVLSVFGTTMTAFAIQGSSGEAWTAGVGVYGKMASWSGIVHAACFFLIGVKLWSFGKRYGYQTQIQFFRERFESSNIGLLLFPILALLQAPYIIIGIIGSGNMVRIATAGAFPTMFPDPNPQFNGGVPFWLGTFLCTGVVWLYVWLGGARATAWANALQTLIFLVVGVVAFWAVADALGGAENATRMVQEYNPSKLTRSVTTEHESNYKQKLAAYRAATQPVARGAAPSPAASGSVGVSPARTDNASRASSQSKGVPLPDGRGSLSADPLPDGRGSLSADPLPDGRGSLSADPLPDGRGSSSADPLPDGRGSLSGGASNANPQSAIRNPQSKPPVPPALRAVKPHKPRGMSELEFLSYGFIPLSVAMFPHLFQLWLTARSAKSFRLTVALHPVLIMAIWAPCIAIGIWATSAMIGGKVVVPFTPEGWLIPRNEPPNQNLVLGMMVTALAHPWLSGLLAAGVLAAILGGMDAQFLCLGSMFTHDVVDHYFEKDRMTDRQRLLTGRIFVVLVVLACWLLTLALREAKPIFGLAIWCFSGFAALFPLVFGALYWKRMTKAGAYASVIAGIGVGIYYYVSAGLEHGFSSRIEPLVPLPGLGHDWAVVPALPMVVAAAAALLLVSLVTAAPSSATVKKFFAEA